MSGLEELSADAIDEALGSESRGVLLDFWSPWCAPCRVLKPHLAKIAAALQKTPEPVIGWHVHAVPPVPVFPPVPAGFDGILAASTDPR